MTEQRVTDPTALEENWKTLVAEVDEDGDGKISRREFRKGMEELGFKLSKAETKSIMEVFDLDGLGEIDFTSFVAFARRQPEAHALYGVERKLRALISKATAQGVDLRESFARQHIAERTWSGCSLLQSHHFPAT